MANTPNLDLVKPAGTDKALVSVINSNSDKIDTGFGSLSDQIATNYASVKYNNAEYINFMRFGKVVFMSCVNGNWDSVSGTSITLNGQSTPAVVPTGFRPFYNAEIKEALSNKRITVNTSGNVICNESFTGTALRYSGCWITNDAVPT